MRYRPRIHRHFREVWQGQGNYGYDYQHTRVETLTKKISDLPAQITVDELRKDVDENAVDINNLGAKVNQIQIDNIKMITTLSSDMGWIKSTLDGINKKLDERGGRNA